MRQALDDHYAEYPEARPSQAEVLMALAQQTRATSADLLEAAALLRAYEEQVDPSAAQREYDADPALQDLLTRASASGTVRRERPPRRPGSG